MTTAKPPVLKNKIFIVYTSHEEKIAAGLKAMLELWGYVPFFCRQCENRDGLLDGTYISDLRKNLEEADLVIFILSQEFQWSQYAQAEIGATMVKGTPRIILLIPPAKLEDVRKIAPMLEDHQSIVADITDQESFFKNLRERLIPTFSATNRQASVDAEALMKSQQKLWDRILAVVEDYKLYLPHRIEARIWDSIREDSPAQLSIVANIKNSLRRKGKLTQLVFVGVSLKFSLALITQALQEFAAEVKKGRDLRKHTRSLKITLIYMDDLSHILHTLNDYLDIDSIRTNLNGHNERTKTWQQYCHEAAITLEEVIQKRIDYIPPRVGILIDGEKLYAGQCYFEPAGTAEPGGVVAYRLLVGERNYFYYTNTDTRGKDAILDFKASINVYSNSRNNGVMLALNRDEWMGRLRSCIESYEDVHDIILISETCTKFESLVTAAISNLSVRHGPKHVKIYVRDPGDRGLSTESKVQVRSLQKRIQSVISEGSSAGGSSSVTVSVEIYYYHHESTFRAALIGRAVLGVQMYERKQEAYGLLELRPGPLRIIAARYSAQFPGLREMVDRFLELNSVDKQPGFTIKCTL